MFAAIAMLSGMLVLGEEVLVSTNEPVPANVTDARHLKWDDADSGAGAILELRTNAMPGRLTQVAFEAGSLFEEKADGSLVIRGATNEVQIFTLGTDIFKDRVDDIPKINMTLERRPDARSVRISGLEFKVPVRDLWIGYEYPGDSTDVRATVRYKTAF